MPSAELLACEPDSALFHGFDNVDFGRFATVIIALSGGSDSTALLYLAREYFRRNRLDKQLLAVTVDHRLRAGSTNEAQQVAKMCADIDVPHRIETWLHDGIATGIQEQARLARYALLGGAARAQGRAIVLTGHNADDDRETRMMREQRAADGKPVDGISTFTLFDNEIWFARPLLSLNKSTLRDYLLRHNTAWIEDPSNDNTSFERIAVRKAIAGSDTGSKIFPVPIKASQSLTAAARLLRDEDLIWFEPSMETVSIGVGATGKAGFFDALRVLLSYVGKTNYLPSEQQVDTAIAALLNGPNKTAFTLNRCLLRRQDDRLTICREARHSGDGVFGFDHILADRNFELAQALRRRIGRPDLPALPRKGVTR